MDHWLATRTVGPGTMNGYRDHVTNKIVPGLGHLPLATIKPSHVRAWVADPSKPLAPATVAKSLVILRDILNTAVADRLIARPPASRQDKVKPPKISDTKRTPWTQERRRTVGLWR